MQGLSTQHQVAGLMLIVLPAKIVFPALNNSCSGKHHRKKLPEAMNNTHDKDHMPQE